MVNNKLKNSIIVFFITLLVLNFVTFFAFPIEGGVVLLAIITCWFAYQIRKKKTITVPNTFVAVTGFSIYILAAQTFSYNVPASWFTVFSSITFILFFILLYLTFEDENQHKIWENSLILAFFVLFLFEGLEILSFYTRFLQIIPQLSMLGDKLNLTFRLSGLFFIHPNVLAGFLNFVYPIVLIRLIQSEKKIDKVLWLMVIICIGLIFFTTISRGATVGALFAGIFLALRYLQFEASKTNFRFHSRAQLAKIGIGAFFALSLTIGVVLQATRTGQLNLAALRSEQLLTKIDSLSSGRGLLWRYAWKAFLEKPIEGHGNGGFTIAYVRSAQLPPGFLALSAHNLWLNVAVEYGLVGLIPLFIVCGVFLSAIVYYLGKTRSIFLSPPDAYMAGVIAFFIHQLFDSMLWVPTYLFSFLVILALLLRKTLTFREWPLERRWFVLFILFISIPLGYSFVVITKLIAPSFLRFSNQSNMYSLNPNQNNLCSLADQYPVNALYSFECSMSLVEHLSKSLPTMVDLQVAQRALYYQERAIELNPYWPPQQANLAVLYWLNKKYGTALEKMRDTAMIAPRNPMVWLNLGWMEEQLGNPEQARDAYVRAVRLSPLVLRSNFSSLSPLFSFSFEDLSKWRASEEKWDDWYEYEIVDKDFMKGIMALAMNKPEDALNSFQTSAEQFEPSYPSFYIHLAYAYYLNHQFGDAYPIAYDFALLDQNGLYKIDDPLLASIIGLILYKNNADDLAYNLFMNSYILQSRASEPMYYSNTYRQPIQTTDISPLLIRTIYILSDTVSGWEWFVKQTTLREPSIEAERIVFWYQHLSGIAIMEKE